CAASSANRESPARLPPFDSRTSAQHRRGFRSCPCCMYAITHTYASSQNERKKSQQCRFLRAFLRFVTETSLDQRLVSDGRSGAGSHDEAAIFVTGTLAALVPDREQDQVWIFALGRVPL